MKHLFTFLLLCAVAIPASSQFGFYKNIFGDYGVEGFDNPPPTLRGMHALDNDGYIISTHSNPYTNYSSYVKLDQNFNTVWTTSYPFTSNQSGLLDHKLELEDHSLISLANGSEMNMILRHDANGNLLSTGKYLSDQSSNYAASAFCKSTLNDTAYVALFAQCAMNYGIVKIANDGEVVWAKDYGGNNVWGNIYDLTQAHNEGYLSIGQWVDYPYDDGEGILLHVGDEGDVIRSMRYKPLVEGKNYSSIRRIIKSPESDHYYASAFVGVRDAIEPLELDNEQYFLQLDTALSVVNSWVFSSYNTAQSVTIEKMIVTSENQLVLYGTLRENVTNYRDLFIMKFDPTEGEILWSKSVQSVEMPFDWASSFAIPGLELHGSDENIVFPLGVQNEGQVIAGIDADGEGLCRSVELDIDVDQGDYFQLVDHPLTAQNDELFRQDIELVPIAKDHQDTTICSNIGTPVAEHLISEEPFDIWSDGMRLILASDVERIASLSLYNLAGQLVLTSSISPYSRQELTLPHGGVFLYRLEDGAETLTGKVSGW
jgi:hypothetical protein